MELPHSITFMATSEMEEQLLETGVEEKPDGCFNMSNLTKEQYLMVRYLFGENWTANSLVWNQNPN